MEAEAYFPTLTHLKINATVKDVIAAEDPAAKNGLRNSPESDPAPQVYLHIKHRFTLYRSGYRVYV